MFSSISSVPHFCHPFTNCAYHSSSQELILYREHAFIIGGKSQLKGSQAITECGMNTRLPPRGGVFNAWPCRTQRLREMPEICHHRNLLMMLCAWVR